MEFELLIIKGKQKNNMAKKIATKVNYQVTELVNNLNEAATTQSEQKRDFFTTRALYNAKRLSTILSNAKVGAMALVLTIGMVACGAPASDASTTAVDTTAVGYDSTATQPAVDTLQTPSVEVVEVK